MKLVRNTTCDGKCKYAIVRLDKIRLNQIGGYGEEVIDDAIVTLTNAGVLEFGQKGSEEECFVLKLKDIFTAAALHEYAHRIQIHAGLSIVAGRIEEAQEWLAFAREINELAVRSENHPSRKFPN